MAFVEPKEPGLESREAFNYTSQESGPDSNDRKDKMGRSDGDDEIRNYERHGARDVA